MDNTEQLFQFYLKNQDDFVKKYNGKILVIHNYKVVKAFSDKTEAYFFAVENFQEGQFILQKCSPGKDDYTATYYSRYSQVQ